MTYKRLPNLPAEILNPDKYLTPIIHMSPFLGRLDASVISCDLGESDIISYSSDILFEKKLPGMITISGRAAIGLALDAIVTSPNFLVSILTPSNSGYVSGCVTAEISKRCKYVFGEDKNADAYFIIHEFGRHMQPSFKVLNSGKPIIEDCAYACVASSFSPEFGRIGNYIIYSLPKAFEIQYGGMLFVRNRELPQSPDISKSSTYLLSRLIGFMKNLHQFNRKRLDVYFKMQELARIYGFKEVLKYNGIGVPHSFIIQANEKINSQHLKIVLNDKGIESSFFFGNDAYFLPCHYNLSTEEIEYMFYHAKCNLQENEE